MRLTIIGGSDTTRFFSGGQVSIGGTPDSNTVHHLVNRKNSRLGNLEINSGVSAGITGAGIRVDGADQTFKFQGTGQSPAGATFQFVGWQGDTIPSNVGQPHLSRDIIRVSQGFVRRAGTQAADTGRYNVLNIEPKYNIWYDSGRTLIRGIYYNPTIQALNKTNHVAYQNTTGSNLMNSTSGNTRIGYALVDTNNTYKLDVNGTGRFRGDVTIDNSGYLKITTNNKLQIGGASYGFNTFMSSAIPNVEGTNNTYIGYADSHNSTNGNNNTIIGAINNRTNVTGSDNVIIGSNMRNYFNIPTTQNKTIMIGATYYMPDTTTFSNVLGIGFNFNRFSNGGTYSNIMDFYGFSGRPENNSLNFGSSDPGGIQLDNVYFNGNTNANGFIGRNITINGSGGATSAGSGIAGANKSGGGITIAGGKGAGSGTPGFVAFSTSTALSTPADSLTLQTLTERARISPTGNLLVGTTTDNGYRVSAVGGTIANGVYGRGYIPFKADYVNDGNTIFSVGNTSDTSTVSIRPGGISESYRVLRIFGSRSGEEVRVNGTNGTNTNQDTTALFEIVSTNAGFLQPRMTNVQRDSISSRPAQGLQIFSTTDSANYVYRGTGGGWQKIANEISGSDTLDFPSTGHGNSADLTIKALVMGTQQT